MNTYQQYWIDTFEKVRSKEELDRAFEIQDAIDKLVVFLVNAPFTENIKDGGIL